MAAVLLLAACACLLLFLHPYVTYPLSLRLFARRPVHPDPAAPLPSATLVFSAFNEQASLPAKIANLRAIRAQHPAVEILAYSDCSTDATLPMLLAEADLLRVVPSTERTGKATGMRRMVEEARGEIMIFTDANVLLDPEAIDPLLRYFSDPAVGGVAGALRYINEDAGAVAKVGGLYWRLEEAIKRRESAVGSIMGADGSIFATRRSLYPQVPPHLLDDMTVSMTVTLKGQRLIHATDVVAYEKNTTESRDEFRRKRRIACRAFNTHRYLWPAIRAAYGPGDRYKYISHKLLRWFGLVPLLSGATLGLAGLLAAGQPLLAAAAFGLALIALLLGRAGFPLLGGLYQILLSVVATLLGVIDGLRGRTYQTWTPAVSRN
ncbi:hypothetical protein SAMIE_1026600 [Sphingobium amiense]|uniref:Glycosyltransferase 2-like domain-containing protein n=2 Tax=Sphingobium amiense TaxID=135719 RepID=A0A494WF29_9SPHN|nr:glycosyltransferase [Sphingobium amiense]BBD99159.1 hypothetical protein SAMIE_1026600 [Sphingobium amiense]